MDIFFIYEILITTDHLCKYPKEQGKESLVHHYPVATSLWKKMQIGQCLPQFRKESAI